MAKTRTAVGLLAPAGAILAGALLLAGCGGAASTASSTAANSAAANVTPAATTTVPAPRLRIVSPRAGAHTGQTLTVSVRLTGGASAGSRVLRYVLDGHQSRQGSSISSSMNWHPDATTSS